MYTYLNLRGYRELKPIKKMVRIAPTPFLGFATVMVGFQVNLDYLNKLLNIIDFNFFFISARLFLTYPSRPTII